ncbi:general odorant-binding protein 84a [Condylostylus longicornis]|uniref:general odorant-binding protein 84a n=1 Tax=Condylostylus longicornis TaxID=2530218 RepID=UPI00244DBB8B|nr:general odorant-binding protein 84a [Condylostylus longicornis]
MLIFQGFAYFLAEIYFLILLNSNINQAALHNLKVQEKGIFARTKHQLRNDEVHDTSFDTEELNIDNIVSSCNDSYKITIDFLEAFNSTAEFPDETDKTPMCFIRCLYERTGIIKEGNLDRNQIVKLMWPATGDSVEVCQKEGDNEKNACLRAYLKGKCLMIRSIVDARNKPKI